MQLADRVDWLRISRVFPGRTVRSSGLLVDGSSIAPAGISGNKSSQNGFLAGESKNGLCIYKRYECALLKSLRQPCAAAIGQESAKGLPRENDFVRPPSIWAG